MARRPFRILTLAASTLALSGCVPGYYAGGPLASLDLYTYESTPDAPRTVRLRDSLTGETFWNVDIPVGQQLVVRFREGENKGDKDRPDIMRWELMKLGQIDGTLDNWIPVPGPHRRRLDLYLRETQEVPQRPVFSGQGASGG